MPPNQTHTLGNDDQAFWGLAAMSAAEFGYPDPPDDQPQWLALAQSVFLAIAGNWDPNTCGGGWRWQIFAFNKGYDYKNTITSGSFMLLAARLFRYTGDKMYEEWAHKAYDWTRDIGLLTTDWRVYDGAVVPTCKEKVDMVQWTYNNGMYLSSSCFLYEKTGDQKWKTAVDNLLQAAEQTFFTPEGIIYEHACEDSKCNLDMMSFKGYLAQHLGYCSVAVPETRERIKNILSTSAIAAGQSCTGGSFGDQCGLNWRLGRFDGNNQVPTSIAALDTFNGLMYSQWGKSPMKATTGGTSPGINNTKGSGNYQTGLQTQFEIKPATKSDKAGAGIATAIVISAMVGLSGWLVY